MKRIIIIALLLSLTGMTIFAQSRELSYYEAEYNRQDATFYDRLEVLETVRGMGLTGIGEFYHNALKLLITKLPDIKTMEEKEIAENSARLLCQVLGDEKYTEAGPEIWLLVPFFDVVNDVNNGFVMQDALIALGQINAKDFLPNIVLALDDLNTRETPDVESKRRIQRAVAGTISALENLHEIEGFRPLFFASIGWYDPFIKDLASAALLTVVDDPAESIIEIIQNTSNNPDVKYEAWREMLLTNAPETSKAKVAAVAIATGWSYSTSVQQYQRSLREMRKSAIDIIKAWGIQDDSVYANLEKSYTNNFVNTQPDYDEIRKALDTLAVIKTDEAVDILFKFLDELHARRRSGPWGNKERQLFQWLLPNIGVTGTKSVLVQNLLTTIQRSDDYTGTEQRWARDALRELGL